MADKRSFLYRRYEEAKRGGSRPAPKQYDHEYKIPIPPDPVYDRSLTLSLEKKDYEAFSDAAEQNGVALMKLGRFCVDHMFAKYFYTLSNPEPLERALKKYVNETARRQAAEHPHEKGQKGVSKVMYSSIQLRIDRNTCEIVEEAAKRCGVRKSDVLRFAVVDTLEEYRFN